MELLVIDPCRYTRLGIGLFIKNEQHININYISSISDLISNQLEKSADIILANLSPYCRYDIPAPELQAFLRQPQRAPCFIYTHAYYPYALSPLYLQHGTYLINKKMTPALLQQLSYHAQRQMSPAHLVEHIYGSLPLLTPREIMVMHDWMRQIPNHRIALRMQLSPRTVYAHKRRLVEKIRVKNRIELCYLYHLLRHIY